MPSDAPDRDSCLVKRLSRYIELTEKERAFVDALEADRQEVPAGAVLSDGSAAQSGPFVLDAGWAVTWVEVRGQRRITRVYLPGEVVGLDLLGADSPDARISMQTDGAICRFPRDRVGTLIAEQPRLAALFVALLGVDQLTLRDRLVAVSAWHAEDRLLHFLLDLRARLWDGTVGSGNRFALPFTQEQIGMAIGATSVTVNKLFKDLRQRGWLEIERPYYRLTARPEMERRIAFCDRYREIDTSWFPAAD